MKTEIMVGIITKSGMGSYRNSPKQNFTEAVIEEIKTNNLFQIEKEGKYIDIVEQEVGNPENIIRSVKLRKWSQILAVRSVRGEKADTLKFYSNLESIDSAIRECNNYAKWYHLDYIVIVFDVEDMKSTEIYRKEAQ